MLHPIFSDFCYVLYFRRTLRQSSSSCQVDFFNQEALINDICRSRRRGLIVPLDFFLCHVWLMLPLAYCSNHCQMVSRALGFGFKFRWNSILLRVPKPLKISCRTPEWLLFWFCPASLYRIPYLLYIYLYHIIYYLWTWRAENSFWWLVSN